MILLGIVGTPAGGKSTVAKYLQSLGATWINADTIARSMLDRDDVKRKLSEYFGEGVLASDGCVDRTALGALVFGHDQEKRANLDYLESVIHPLTRIEITQQLQVAAGKGVQVAILDVPLLFESGWDVCCDEIWCVDGPPSQRLKRVASRGWDESELSRREANQLPIEVKSRLSNRVVWNDSTLADLHKKIDRAWSKLVTMEEINQSPAGDHCFHPS